MSTAVTTSRPANGNVQLLRPARALVGWMSQEEAAQWLAGPGQVVMEAHHDTVRRARETVSKRHFHQGVVLGALPPQLGPHVEALRVNPASAMFFQEGWDVAIADLSSVCAIQRHVLTGDAMERVAAVDAADMVAIASVTLPQAEPRQLAAAFDPVKQSWVFSSANPNLRIAGQFHAEVQPGFHGFGFVVSLSTSFLQVARYRDRYLLRDGYHRAYGFLARGVSHLPVFVREFETFEAMGLPQAGLSPHDSFLGATPPTLSDYLDDTVSAAVTVPATQKVVVVQGLEVNTL